MSQSIEHNLKPTIVRTIIANSPDANNYSFKQWTGDVDHITTGLVTDSQVVVTIPNHSVVLTSTYNPYRVLTVNQGVILPGILTNINYGKLYNWYAATDNRNLSNTGWHIPTSTEATTLQTYLGGGTNMGGKLKEIGFTYWLSPNTGATNEVGFNVRGNGIRISGVFNSNTVLMCSNLNGIYFYGINILATTSYGSISNDNNKNQGSVIRLIKDSTTLTHGQTGSYIGNDEKVYRSICVGTQEWMSSNLAETKYRDGSLINATVYTNSAWAALTIEAMCSYNNNDSYI